VVNEARTTATTRAPRRAGETAIFELMKTSHLWHRPSGPLSLAELGDWYATFAIGGLGGPRGHDRKPA
jgi:hypothetical protein